MLDDVSSAAASIALTIGEGRSVSVLRGSWDALAPVLGGAALKVVGDRSGLYARAEGPDSMVLYPAIRSSGSIQSSHPGVFTEPHIVRDGTNGQEFVATVRQPTAKLTISWCCRRSKSAGAYARVWGGRS